MVSVLTMMAHEHRKRFPLIIDRFEERGPFWRSYSHWGMFP